MVEFPMYMLMGDVLVPIGLAAAFPTTAEHVNISGELDTFPGERLTFSRIVHWEEFLEYTKHRYPEGFIVVNNDPMDAAEKIVEQDPPPADLVDKVKEALSKEKHPKDKK